MDGFGNAFVNKYREELIANAKAISAPGKGILAADESTGTIGKRVSTQSKCFVFGSPCSGRGS